MPDILPAPSARAADLARLVEVARQRNERWIAAFAMVLSLFMSAEGWSRAAGGERGYGIPIGVVCFILALYYALGFHRARRQAPGTAEYLFRTAFEVSIPTLLLWLHSRVSVELALLNVASVVYAIAIFLPVLRLHRALALFAGTLATVEWLVSYRLLITPELAAHPALSMATALERGALLCFCGIFASRMAGTLYELTERMADATLERERIRRAFGSYVAEPVVQRVLDGDLKLGAERRVISVLFVDIREFTPFSQQTHPDEVFRKLNLALAAFADQVAAHGGIVNKFLGDGLMAIFGAPLDDPDHALKACRAALGIAQVAASLRDSGAYPELRIGVGLHCGEVVVGDVGGVEHREYTAIGDVVNVSARVEAATKEVGAEVLVTDEVLRGLTGGVTPGRSFRTRLRGHDQELVLHELVACVED